MGRVQGADGLEGLRFAHGELLTLREATHKDYANDVLHAGREAGNTAIRVGCESPGGWAARDWNAH